jgi:hypothetical protein
MKKKLRKGKSGTGKNLLVVCMVAFLISFLTGCNPYNCDNLPEEYQNLEESTQHMYVLWRAANESMNDFRNTLFDDIAPELLARSPEHLTVIVAEPDIESITLIGVPREDGSLVSALISATVASRVEAETFAGIIEPMVAFVAGYEVIKTVPLDYQKTWPDGEASPGIQQVTFLQQRQDMQYEVFRDYWFCSHTPFGVDIHPFWRYERNEVVEAITADAPSYNGIVELHFYEIEDLTDPNRFFGGSFLINAVRVLMDVSNFIDMGTIEVTAMTEYILKSS